MTWLDSHVLSGLSRLWPSGQKLERCVADGLISASELHAIGDLSAELTQTLAQINESLVTAPATPSLNVWRAKADALREIITAEQAHVC